MDLLDLLLNLFPAWAPYVLAASGLAAWIVATFPAPQAAPAAAIWKVLNLLGANVRHARNREPTTDPLAPGAVTKPPDRT